MMIQTLTVTTNLNRMNDASCLSTSAKRQFLTWRQLCAKVGKKYKMIGLEHGLL